MPAVRGPARPAERRAAPPAAAALAALALACGVEDPADQGADQLAESAAAPASPAPREDPLGELAALGYSGWDEVDDEEVTAASSGVASSWPRVFANDRDLVTVLDPEGRVLRTLRVPDRTQVEFARVLPGGRIACVSVDEGLTLLEADGTVVWAVDMPCHHEVALVPEARPAGERRLAVAVHHEREHRGRRVRFDEVVFVEERDGSAASDLPTWRTHDHLEGLMGRAAGPHPLDRAPEGAGIDGTVYDYFHLNAISFSAPGTMLLCLRNVDLLVEVDVASGAPGRSVGPGILDWPHAPSAVGDGARWLVFDNGKHRGWSRVVELDPDTGEVSWAFPAAGAGGLFSEVRGFAQRLPGGTTLITESERGRALEVSHAGDVLWEYLNHEVRTTPQGTAVRRRIYRMTAVPPEDVAP